MLSATDEVFDDGDRKWSMIDDLDPVDDTQEDLANLLVCANWLNYACVSRLALQKMIDFLLIFFSKFENSKIIEVKPLQLARIDKINIYE